MAIHNNDNKYYTKDDIAHVGKYMIEITEANGRMSTHEVVVTHVLVTSLIHDLKKHFFLNDIIKSEIKGKKSINSGIVNKNVLMSMNKTEYVLNYLLCVSLKYR